MNPANPPCFLFDNGSLRAASTLNLRRIAADLEARLHTPVFPVSLLHSSGVDTAALMGVPARLLEPALQTFLSRSPTAEAVLLPLFFGPSAALTDYVPERVSALLKTYPRSLLRQAAPLNPDPAVAEPLLVRALAARVLALASEKNLVMPQVVLVDHGSPQKRVAQVRDSLGAALALALQGRVGGVHVASMERRPGAEYDFNEPLLATRLATPPCDEGDVIVLLQFLSPGRHAGPDGDVAAICREAGEKAALLRTHLSDTLGSSPEIVEILAERYFEALVGK